MSAASTASRENVSTLRTSSDDEKPKLDDIPGSREVCTEELNHARKIVELWFLVVAGCAQGAYVFA